MEILKYFERTDTDDIHIYRIKRAEYDDFISELTDEFRLSYISDEELAELSTKSKISKSDFLEKYILPDKGNIKSGDFGEILSFHTVIENYKNKGIELKGPFKWRWKDRNKAAQYSDAVLFCTRGEGNDLIVAIESKMKATASKSHRIQDAINGSEDDRLTRLTKTLFWLEEKYARLGDHESRILTERFAYPSKYGAYDKIFKAIAIVDKTFEDNELEREFNKNDDIIVVLFSINDLKNAYEQTRLNMINSVKEDE